LATYYEPIVEIWWLEFQNIVNYGIFHKVPLNVWKSYFSSWRQWKSMNQKKNTTIGRSWLSWLSSCVLCFLDVCKKIGAFFWVCFAVNEWWWCFDKWIYIFILKIHEKPLYVWWSFLIKWGPSKGHSWNGAHLPNESWVKPKIRKCHSKSLT
jgi:hypothetical protein